MLRSPSVIAAEAVFFGRAWLSAWRLLAAVLGFLLALEVKVLLFR